MKQIKKSDYRIGNIVKAIIERDADLTEIIGKVSQITVDGVYLSNIENNVGIKFEYDDICPILLTKELYDKIEEENKDMTMPSIYIAHSLDWLQNMAYLLNGKELKIERSWL